MIKYYFIFLLLLFILAEGNAIGKQVYYSKGECDEGFVESSKELIGQADPRFLPKFKGSQGETGTCGYHVGMYLVNAIYKKKMLDEGKGVSGDLSTVDAVLKDDRCTGVDKIGSLNAEMNMAPFLVSLAKRKDLGIDIERLSMKRVDKINKKLNNPKECENIDEAYLKNLKTNIDNCGDVLKKIKEGEVLNKDLPVKRLVDLHYEKNRIPVPEYSVVEKDYGNLSQPKERAEALLKDILEHFSQGQSGPNSGILPIGFSTCFKGEEKPAPDCKTGKHAIIGTKIEKITCSKGDNKYTFHRVYFDNSWGKKGKFYPEENEKGFILENILRGMAFNQLGFTQIKDKKSENILENEKDPESSALGIYAYINDSEAFKKLMQSKKLDINKEYLELSPLVLTLKNSNEEISKILLQDPRLDINKTYGGSTVLIMALERSSPELLQQILDHPRTDIKKQLLNSKVNPLEYAAARENIEALKILISQRNIPIENKTLLVFENLFIKNNKIQELLESAIHGNRIQLLMNLLSNKNLVIQEEDLAKIKIIFKNNKEDLFSAAVNGGREKLIRELLPDKDIKVNLAVFKKIQYLLDDPILSSALINKADINLVPHIISSNKIILTPGDVEKILSIINSSQSQNSGAQKQTLLNGIREKTLNQESIEINNILSDFDLKNKNAKVLLYAQEMKQEGADKILSGFIGISNQNTSPAKEVKVFYTLNDWQDKKEVPATYLEGGKNGLSDLWKFEIKDQDLKNKPKSLKYYIQFIDKSNNMEYYDNNNQKNYHY